jgi:hypothetical protein
MDFCLGQAKQQLRVAAAKPPAKARRELVPGAMQPAAPGSFAEKLQEKVNRERDSPERLRPEVPAWRWAQPTLAFAAPGRPRLVPSRDQLGYERCLCSCRSNRRS